MESKPFKEVIIMGDSCCGGGHTSGFALIVTLFILLVIVGAAWIC